MTDSENKELPDQRHRSFQVSDFSLRDTPATLLTLIPAARADSLAWASSAPGCIHMCLMPAAIASATIWRVMAGGVMMERASGTMGSSAIAG